MPHHGVGFPGGSVVKNLPANGGDPGGTGSISGLGRPLEEEMATHSRILPSRVRGTKWQWATVHRLAETQTQLSTHTHTSASTVQLLENNEGILYKSV